ncbi:putative transcription factor C2H2 family [Helianthus annuus]|nr:putative transcription factor C2H2 family [Helianthus annuus]KAJ0767755.1 putative transcription factor C2H2 family [Helianthus annuus]
MVLKMYVACGHETNNRASTLYSSRRRTELLRRSLLSSIDSQASSSGGQNRNLFSRIPPHVNASASHETGIPIVNTITGHHHHRARTLNRQVNGAFGFPYLSSTTFSGGSERRGRLVAEMHNVLDRIRRGEGLRFEDVMLLNQFVFYGLVDIHDRHRDMRLDIDNMSYEPLEERIGNVNTGLTEENIYKHLKQKTYASVAGETDAKPCCICQEEYKNGDDLGALGCGHEFHTGCIKQWLL